ncbi:RNA recognition motif domain-containing protein [Chloroflexota bacterium]
MKSNIRIHVGNLARTTTEEELRHEFEVFGEVDTVNIIKDNSGVSKGFAFVEMLTKDEGYAAIEGLKGKMLNFRTLDVTQANPRTGGKKGGRPHRRRGR